jgi:hypothetical protein
MPAFLNISGQRFSRLTVLKLAPKTKNDRVRWLCRCDCGTALTVDAKSLRNGDTKSCGCLKSEMLQRRNFKHGNSHRRQWSPTYRSWANMFHFGNDVCKRWSSFEAFLADKGERPKGTVLNRIDKRQGYFPENCEWSSRLLQARFTDLTGQKFGCLTVLKISHRAKYNSHNRIVWHCRCDCGTETRTATTADLRNGNTWSCGCFKIEHAGKHSITHGHTSGGWSTTFRAWSEMKTRCYNKNSKRYADWGGRGITVCERWRHSFENFLVDMGEKPEGMVLDRIDNNGNYEPGNCRWATWSESNKNRRKFKRRRRR